MKTNRLKAASDARRNGTRRLYLLYSFTAQSSTAKWLAVPVRASWRGMVKECPAGALFITISKKQGAFGFFITALANLGFAYAAGTYPCAFTRIGACFKIIVQRLCLWPRLCAGCVVIHLFSPIFQRVAIYQTSSEAVFSKTVIAKYARM